MKKILLFAVALATVALSSCTQTATDTVVTGGGTDTTTAITFNTTLTETRVTDNIFDIGDQISVIALDSDEIFAANVPYIFNGELFASDSPIFYSDSSQSLEFWAIYPALDDFATDFDFSVATDQSSGDNFEMSDLLVSMIQSTSESCPTLTFNHVMSNIIMNIETPNMGDGVLTIYGATSTSINMNDGIQYASASQAAAITAASNGTDSFKAIIVPQIIEAGTLMATYEIDGTTYEWHLSNDTTIQLGYRYTCNWNLIENLVSFETVIDDWNDGTLDSGDSEIPFENTIAHASNADNAGSTYTDLMGTVVALTSVSYVVAGETGAVLIYAAGTPPFAIGDIVTISGTTNAYAGLGQFSSPEVTKIGEREVDFSSPVEMSGADMDAYLSDITAKYVKYTGTLSESGSYVNITINDASSAVGSIAYAPDGLYDESLVGSEVDVYGYLMGVTGTKYIQTITVCIVAAGADFALPEYDADEDSTDESYDANIFTFEALSNTASTTDATYTIDGVDFVVNNTSYSTTYGNATVYEGGYLYNTTPLGDDVATIILNYSSSTAAYHTATLYAGDSSNPTTEITEKSTSSKAVSYTVPAGTKYFKVESISGYFYLVSIELSSEDSEPDVTDPDVDEDVDDPDPGTTEITAISTAVDINNVGTTYCVEGIVTATCTAGFILTDNSASIYVYYYGHTYAAGDALTIEGATTSYGGSAQFSGSSCTITEGASVLISDSIASVYGGTELDAYTTGVKYVEIEGDLVVSGSYTNVTVDGTTKKLSINSTTVLTTADYDGQTVKVTGYITGCNTTYIYFVATAIETI